MEDNCKQKSAWVILKKEAREKGGMLCTEVQSSSGNMDFPGVSAFLFSGISEENLLISVHCFRYRWALLGTWGKAQTLNLFISSVLRPTCFSPAADPYMWEGITPEQWSRAEQGQNCTQRHHRTMASASSTAICQTCGEKELIFLSEAGSTVPLTAGPCLALTLQLCAAFLSCPIWPLMPFTLLHLPHLPAQAGKTINKS